MSLLHLLAELGGGGATIGAVVAAVKLAISSRSDVRATNAVASKTNVDAQLVTADVATRWQQLAAASAQENERLTARAEAAAKSAEESTHIMREMRDQVDALLARISAVLRIVAETPSATRFELVKDRIVAALHGEQPPLSDDEHDASDKPDRDPMTPTPLDKD